ncbi:MAG TPA: hypothetical protein VM677_14930 [Actinokineospora sp.]|jgi:hypothetical protein|nr:hypothetical protein [Actinokineospora sp.]
MTAITLYTKLFNEISRGGIDRVATWAYRELDRIAGGGSPIRAVSHPLGFLCLPIDRSGDEGVCIHLWLPGTRSATLTTSAMHCHSWDLLSAVVAGELANQTFRIVDDVESPQYRVFAVLSDESGDELRATNRLVRAETVDRTEHRAGDRYRLRAGVFHRTVVADDQDPVVTVALGVTRDGAVDLSLGSARTGDHQERRELCGLGETVRAAELGRSAVAELVDTG